MQTNQRKGGAMKKQLENFLDESATDRNNLSSADGRHAPNAPKETAHFASSNFKFMRGSPSRAMLQTGASGGLVVSDDGADEAMEMPVNLRTSCAQENDLVLPRVEAATAAERGRKGGSIVERRSKWRQRGQAWHSTQRLSLWHQAPRRASIKQEQKR